MEKYGKDFKYEDFIPMWKAENWDPKQWEVIRCGTVDGCAGSWWNDWCHLDVQAS